MGVLSQGGAIIRPTGAVFNGERPRLEWTARSSRSCRSCSRGTCIIAVVVAIIAPIFGIVLIGWLAAKLGD